MSSDLTRRDLLRHASLAGGLAAIGGVWTEGEARASRSPNEKLHTAHIGVGGMGASDLSTISSHPNVQVVALCDVDEARAADSFKDHPSAAKFWDFRKMLDKQGKNIDAVVVSTPDHCHAPAAVLAMKMGKHVYCQKPLAHSIEEARIMMQTARKHKVVTQMGTQGHPTYARTVELIQAGVIGPVREVHVITDRPMNWWPQGMTEVPPTEPVPATLHWNQWLGPARERPYSSKYLPFVWRGWWDFGTGALGDMACHLMDGPYWALNLKYPTSVVAETDTVSPLSSPLWSVITYEFPQRGDQPPVKLIWYDGGKTPPASVMEGQKLDNGSVFVGDKGKLFIEHLTGDEPKLLPEKDFAGFKGPDPTIPRVANHYFQWVDAARSGSGTTGSNFDYACPLTESVLLGNVAIRTGRKIDWDSEHLKARGFPEADKYIRYHHRPGWSL